MERERTLIMGGKAEKVPRELADHPVFIVNKQANNAIAKTRAKLKTNREKNAERLIKQGAKWERERLIYDELDKQKEIELKKKREASLLLEDEYTQSNKVRGMDLLRIKNRDYTDCEMDLKNFLDQEKKTMTGKSEKKKKTKRVEKIQSHVDMPTDGITDGEVSATGTTTATDKGIMFDIDEAELKVSWLFSLNLL